MFDIHQYQDFAELSGGASLWSCLLLSITQNGVAKTHPVFLGDNTKNCSCTFCFLRLHLRKFFFTNVLQSCSKSLTFATVTELSVGSSPQPFGLSPQYPNPNPNLQSNSKVKTENPSMLRNSMERWNKTWERASHIWNICSYPLARDIHILSSEEIKGPKVCGGRMKNKIGINWTRTGSDCKWGITFPVRAVRQWVRLPGSVQCPSLELS